VIVAVNPAIFGGLQLVSDLLFPGRDPVVAVQERRKSANFPPRPREITQRVLRCPQQRFWWLTTNL